MTRDQHYNYTCIHGPRCGSQKTVCKTRSVPTQLITISKTSSCILHACHNSKISWHTCIMSHAFDLKIEVSLPKHRTVQRLTSVCPCAIPVVPPVTVDQPQANDVVDKQLGGCTWLMSGTGKHCMAEDGPGATNSCGGCVRSDQLQKQQATGGRRRPPSMRWHDQSLVLYSQMCPTPHPGFSRQMVKLLVVSGWRRAMIRRFLSGRIAFA